ncbi:MAG: MAPEG family protein [Paracoccaceae bacterium]|jgi:uncharacterized protein|nr:MAPEG family protein [Paracoccaceae bacterium]
MTPPIITALYAGLAGLIYVWLTLAVVRHRRGKRILHGDGDDAKVAKSIRGQGNAAEQMPMILILMGLTEMLGAPSIALHVAGLAFIIGRVLHGLHFNGYIGFQARPAGMGLTLLVLIVLSLGLVAHAVVQMG